ncbi:MAG TPA: hypothetical protein VJN48_09735, partial [Terriglobales bacterium]|nr:hypothetical protein [Terriglobales bacterium]
MAHLITKKRVGEAVAIILTIWLALLVCFVGYSVFFPVWVYGIFSASQSNGPGFFLYGLGAPFRDYPGGAWIATILLCLVALVAHSYTRSRLTRNAGRIFFGSVVVGIATVALTYYFCGPLYSRAV